MGWKRNRKKRGGADQHHPQAGLIARQGHKQQLPKRRTHRGHRGRGHDERKWQERTGASSHGYKPPELPQAASEPELAATQPIAPQTHAEAQDRPGGQTGQQPPAPQQSGRNQANPGTTGAGGEPETRLFDAKSEFQPDARLVRRAVKHRWEVDKRLSNIVLQKALTLAAGLPWTGPDGVTRKEEFTPPQLIGTAKLALDIERQNQAEDHHGDRMDYAERALQARAKIGEYRPPTSIGVETSGAAKVAIYLPDNLRDVATLDAIIDQPAADEMAKELP